MKLTKNKRLPPLAPSNVDNLISSSPNQFGDLRVKISLIEKARSSSSTVDLNNIINQLKDIVTKDDYAFSIISTSNANKKDELSRLEMEFESQEQDFNIFKSNISIVKEIQKVDIEGQISRLRKSIQDIKSVNLNDSQPKMKKSIENPGTPNLIRLLQLYDYNFKILENYIYYLQKRITIIDQSDEHVNSVNTKFGSVTNLVDLHNNLVNENEIMKSNEKMYFKDKILRRYPFSKLPNLCNKLLADSLQFCFEKEIMITRFMKLEYDETKGNNAEAFLKEEKELPTHTIKKMQLEISQLEQKINESNQLQNTEELEFDRLRSCDLRVKKLNKECIQISQMIKKVLEEREINAKSIFEITNNISKLKVEHGKVLEMNKQNLESLKSLYQCSSSFGYSLLSQSHNDLVYKWLSLKKNNGIFLDEEKINNIDNENQNIDEFTLLTRPSSTLVMPQLNYIRKKVKKAEKQRKGVDLLTDGIVSEIMSSLDVMSKIGKEMKFIDPQKSSESVLQLSKKFFSELSQEISPSIHEMKDFMFSNIDRIQIPEHQILVKKYVNKLTQISLLVEKETGSQTDPMPKNAKKGK